MQTVYAQDWQAELLEDMVTISAGKMTADDYTLVTFSNTNTLQIKSYAEAPATGVISRDNFVSFFTYVIMEIINTMIAADPDATTKDMDEIIGNPDIVINCYMAKSGIQVETITSEGTTRNTMKWEDLIK